MRYERGIEVALISILGLLGFGVLNPYWMPMGVELFILLALGILFAIYAAFLFREQGGDEREVMIRHRADRLAFLSGTSLLILAVIVDFYMTHYVNKWVVVALIIMVLTKILAYTYYQNR